MPRRFPGAPLVDDVPPEASMRQWVLSVPYALCFLYASDLASLSESLGIVYRAIAAFQIKDDEQEVREFDGGEPGDGAT